MNPIVPIVVRLAATDVGAAARRVKRNTLLYAVTALLALTAYACAVAGGVIWVAGEWGAVAATFAVAAGFAALALAVIALVAVFNAADRRRARQSAGPTALYAAAALAALPLLSRSKLTAGLLVAGLAAFAAARSQQPREAHGDRI